MHPYIIYIYMYMLYKACYNMTNKKKKKKFFMCVHMHTIFADASKFVKIIVKWQ